MAVTFPSFRYDARRKTWRGCLKPTDDSPAYRVKLTYRLPRSPQVWVTRPVLHPDAPHRYQDGSLCLYYPRDGDWHAGRFIAETIVPWAAEWLFYYEAWLLDPERRWLGSEAPHGPLKRPAR